MKKLTYLLSFVCCGALAVCSQSAMTQDAASSGVLPETAENFDPRPVPPAMVRPAEATDFGDHADGSFGGYMRGQSLAGFPEPMSEGLFGPPHRAIDSNTQKEIESAQNLAQKLHRAIDELVNTKDDAKRTTLTTAIQKALNEQFERDLKQREDELAKVEARVKALRTQLDKRKAAQADIVQLKLQTMVNEAHGLGFPASGMDSAPWNVRGLPRPSDLFYGLEPATGTIPRNVRGLPRLTDPAYGVPATVGPDFPRPSTGAALEPFFPGEVEPENTLNPQ